MTAELEAPLYDHALDNLHLYTVGFLFESRDEIGTFMQASGSGVLAELDGHKGIITAAHVVRELEKHKSLGLFTVTGTPGSRSRPILFQSNEIRSVKLGSEDSPTGPDLALVRVPHKIETLLAARNVFYNFNRRWGHNEELNPDDYQEVVVGVVGEKTRLKEFVAGDRRVDERTMDKAIGK